MQLDLLTSIFLKIRPRLMAKAGLNIEKLFSPDYYAKHDGEATLIKGDALNKYNISLYHSITIPRRAKEGAIMSELVLKDVAANRPLWTETQYVKKDLYYGFYQLKPRRGLNRYIFYLNKHPKHGHNIILIYIEGSAGPEEIKKMLKK